MIELRPGEQKDIVVLLGQAAGRSAAVDMIERYRKIDVEALLRDVQRQWENNLGAVQVRTPDHADGSDA